MKSQAKAKIYVGCKAGETSNKREIFKSVETPTFRTHGGSYNAVIGPFVTMRGARFMALYGQGNPHVQCVADAEKLGKKYALPTGRSFAFDSKGSN